MPGSDARLSEDVRAYRRYVIKLKPLPIKQFEVLLKQVFGSM